MTKDQAIQELSAALLNAIDVLDSKEMSSLFTLAHAHRYRWTGATVDTKKARELIENAARATDSET